MALFLLIHWNRNWLLATGYIYSLCNLEKYSQTMIVSITSEICKGKLRSIAKDISHLVFVFFSNLSINCLYFDKPIFHQTENRSAVISVGCYFMAILPIEYELRKAGLSKPE